MARESPLGCADDSAGDLAAVGNQDLLHQTHLLSKLLLNKALRYDEGKEAKMGKEEGERELERIGLDMVTKMGIVSI